MRLSPYYSPPGLVSGWEFNLVSGSWWLGVKELPGYLYRAGPQVATGGAVEENRGGRIKNQRSGEE